MIGMLIFTKRLDEGPWSVLDSSTRNEEQSRKDSKPINWEAIFQIWK